MPRSVTVLARAVQAGDQSFLKQLNRSAILELIRCQPGLTRAELAAQAQLTKATVGTVVQRLLDEQWLSEGELNQGSLGRPGRALHLNESARLVLGAEVGVQGLRVAACSMTGQILASAEVQALTGSPEQAAAALSHLIAGVLARPELERRQVIGLGIALPGPVAQPEQRLLFAPNLGWRDVAFLELLLSHLPELPGLRLIENEANAAAFGEAYLSSRQESGLLAYLSLNSGIGAGLVGTALTPQLLRGAQHFAGEVGHSLMQPGGLYCHCGNRGCIETLLSGWAIRAALNLEPGEDLRDAVTARQANAEVQHTLRRAGVALGVLLTNLHHTLNPGRIVIGGSLTRLPGPLLPSALEFFADHQHRLFGIDRPVEIEVRPDSTFLPARGAAAQVLAEVIQVGA